MANSIPGVFCLEAEWTQDLKSPDSVRPVIDFFTATAPEPMPLVYRQVLSKADIELCIARWRRSKYKRFDTIYFAAHGKPGKLDLWNKEVVTLEDLASMLQGACRGKNILFGSCRVLGVTEARIESFLRVTGARSASGYAKSPTWAESTALDLIVMETLRRYNSPKHAWKWLQENCLGLLNLYGFQLHVG